MTQSKIEWTDRSDWNPVRGCTRVTEGCRNCYAESIAGRFSGHNSKTGEPLPYHGYATIQDGKARWTGKVELQPDRLTLPMRWRKPAKIFVNSTSDIFHESLSGSDIDRIFAVMALCPQHTFQILTKRPKRMRDYVNGRQGRTVIGGLGGSINGEWAHETNPWIVAVSFDVAHRNIDQ